MDSPVEMYQNIQINQVKINKQAQLKLLNSYLLGHYWSCLDFMES